VLDCLWSNTVSSCACASSSCVVVETQLAARRSILEGTVQTEQPKPQRAQSPLHQLLPPACVTSRTKVPRHRTMLRTSFFGVWQRMLFNILSPAATPSSELKSYKRIRFYDLFPRMRMTGSTANVEAASICAPPDGGSTPSAWNTPLPLTSFFTTGS
jgi:hypothetical protein